MTEQLEKEFASIELARLYESQGYKEDALVMYRTLIDADGTVDVVSEAHEAIARLEVIADTAAAGNAELKPGGYRENENKVARLLEKWLTLMVIHKRVNVYKSIWDRL